MKLFLSETNKVLFKPDTNDIMLGDECCCEWISYNFTQEGFYACNREGGEFSYNDPILFCGTPFEFTKTARNLVTKLNYEGSPFCGGTHQPDIQGQDMYEEGSINIKMFLIKPLTITITPSSYYNDSNLGVNLENQLILGRGDNFWNVLPLVTVNSDGDRSSKRLISVPDTTYTHYTCTDLSTDIHWENEANADPWVLVLNAGNHIINLEFITEWIAEAESTPYLLYEIVSDFEWDMFGIGFSRNIPPEVEYE